MDISHLHAALLRQVMKRANLSLGEVWRHYFSFGGDVSAMEIEAFLHHALSLPRLQRDMLAHAVNELIDQQPTIRAPYTKDVIAMEGVDEVEGG